MAPIVNGDDFGISKSVNSAIAEAFEKRLINRTTLMVNMPDAAGAMELARENHFDDRVGLHLNLTSGVPLTAGIASDPVMCTSDGEFSARFARNLRTRFFLPKKTRKNVEEEIRAQLDKYRSIGGTLWHIDSHHHVHTDPSVWLILKRVINDYPVTSIRIGRNMYRGGNPLMRLYKLILNASIRKHCSTGTGYFGSAADYETYMQGADEDFTHEEIEIMVHPLYGEDGRIYDKCMDKLLEMKEFG